MSEAPGSILLVCSANVCRSPLAAAVFQSHLHDTPLTAVEVGSAGTEAKVGAEMCSVAAASLQVGERNADAHRARSLDADMVLRADIVFTMERAQRATLASLAPQARAMVFTLIEARWLAQAALQRGAAPAGVKNLPELARVLHGLRGTVEMPEPFRWPRPRRAPSDATTIADGHGHAPRAHAAAVQQVRDTSEALVESISLLVR